MEYRALGNSGLKVSCVGLGCNNFGGRLDFEGTRKVVHRALDLGITLLDTSDTYGNRGGSEEFLGRILGARRKEIVLATKFGMEMDAEGKLKGASRGYIMSEVTASLRRLKTDWIDLYQIHRPDPETPIEETLRALDDLVRQGKVRYIGCSNFSAQQLEEALQTSKSLGLGAFVTCQDQYSLLVRDLEGELLPAIDAHGLGLLPYTPLGGGLLTGKYQANAPLPEDARLAKTPTHRLLNDDNFRIVEHLRAFCTAHGRTVLALAFSWLLAHKAVPSVIAGAMKPEQLDLNVRAADWALTGEEMAEIDRLTQK